ncbi:twin-arginine translocase subunit TatB [Roseospira marina]|uniref:Sec-independent protein translocase protein TatB n=1 Tax=Roseospira marina TaxID=140057 RepID=A0A5M6IGT2_9PROT|nr:Sec-independent protein translocase protein TatB [Roseospira marina]KAA5606885.1 twin-arginine translocase subunit TatB [Roseospira marina]MBB4312944.1 sec-independent protein translocase protein TatB [Roseospira marina]MBB5086283.1 sec-independent protein translocase protein TatB [Roseospira marina]
MLDFGWTELAVIAVIALVVIGPKDLPKVLRTMGQWTRRLRGLAREFQGHIDDVIREAELDDVRDGIKKARRTNIGQSINKMVDPDGTVTRELNDIGRDGGRRRTATPARETLDHGEGVDPTGPAATAADPASSPAQAGSTVGPETTPKTTTAKTRTDED